MASSQCSSAQSFEVYFAFYDGSDCTYSTSPLSAAGLPYSLRRVTVELEEQYLTRHHLNFENSTAYRRSFRREL